MMMRSAIIFTGLLLAGCGKSAAQADIQPRDWRYYVANPAEIELMQKVCREWAGSTAPTDTEPAVVTTNCRAAAFAKSQLQITN